jgi:molecular chaperone DnaK
MVKDAEVHAEEDKKRRETIDAKNQADQMIYSLEKLLKDNKDKVSEEDAKALETEIANTKKAIESEDLEQIKSATEALSQASHKITEMMYQQAGAQQQAEQQDPEAQGDVHGEAQGQQQEDKAEEEVIDAEVVDEEEKK